MPPPRKISGTAVPAVRYDSDRIVIPTGFTIIQPNKVFEDEKEMYDWLKVNIAGATVVKTWRVDMLVCEVVCPIPKAPVMERKKKK